MSKGIYQHKPHSQETKRKIGEANRGRIRSEAIKLKMRKPNNRWSSFRKSVCSCGRNLPRGNRAGICWLCSRQKRSGVNHYNWKGGITPVNKKIRMSSEYKLWRKAVFERDNYTCQKCNVRGVYLEANHDLPFSLFPDLRFEVLNGETLCKSCHSLTPTYKGRIRKYAFI